MTKSVVLHKIEFYFLTLLILNTFVYTLYVPLNIKYGLFSYSKKTKKCIKGFKNNDLFFFNCFNKKYFSFPL